MHGRQNGFIESPALVSSGASVCPAPVSESPLKMFAVGVVVGLASAMASVAFVVTVGLLALRSVK